MKKLFIASLVSLALAINAEAQLKDYAIASGLFKPTDESLSQYKYPEWFRDAKLGF